SARHWRCFDARFFFLVDLRCGGRGFLLVRFLRFFLFLRRLGFFFFFLSRRWLLRFRLRFLLFFLFGFRLFRFLFFFCLIFFFRSFFAFPGDARAFVAVFHFPSFFHL